MGLRGDLERMLGRHSTFGSTIYQVSCHALCVKSHPCTEGPDWYGAEAMLSVGSCHHCQSSTDSQ